MMKDKNRKFRLGDIIQKLNQSRTSPTDVRLDNVSPSQQPVAQPSQLDVKSPSPEDTTSATALFAQPQFAKTDRFSQEQERPLVAAAQLPEKRVEPEQATRSFIPQVQSPMPIGEDRDIATHNPSNRAQSFDSSVADESEGSEFDFMHYIGILIRRKNVILVFTILAGLFSLTGYLRAVKYYTAHGRMLFAPGYQDIMGDNSNAWIAMSRDEQKFNTHLELLKSNTVLKRVSESLDNKISANGIIPNLSIARGENKGEKNDIVDITFKHTDQHLAQDVVNQICKTYIDYMKEVNVQDVTRLILKLEDQIAKVQIELDQKENMLRMFKEKNRTVELSTETNITVSKLSQIELELQKTQMDMLESKERFFGIKKEIGQQEINVIQSMTYQNPFQTKLAELELEANSLSAEYSPEHFKVKMVKNQIDKIKDAMKTDITKEAASRTFVKNPIRESMLQELVNLTIEKSALDAKRTAQEQIISQLDAELGKLPTIELQYAQLTRETESLVQVLKLMKTRFEEAKIKRDSQESDLKILEWAQLPTGGVSSVPFTKALLGFLIGLVIGIAIALALEFLDQSIKDPNSVERILEIPLLGIVPMIEMEKALIENAPAKWKTVLEPFRALRATLKHLANVRQFKTLIVCSAVKGEGKTTLAANLAITFSLDGKKVILVDGDLRRPQMHTLFNVEKYTGLSDFLLGAKEVEDILKPTVHENLSVITAGEHPQNPSELIGSMKFDELVLKLRGMADFVIFDSPALLPVSDSLSMAPKMDACIMVVRALWTPLKAAQQAKSQLKRIGTNMVGAVLNGISHSRGYYPYYYGYYRYYAYKYTYEEDHDRPRDKLTIREIGLNIESALKAGLRATVFSMPQHIGNARRFLNHLFRRKLFLFLLFLSISLPIAFAALKFAGIISTEHVSQSENKIQFIGNVQQPAPIEQLATTASTAAIPIVKEAVAPATIPDTSSSVSALCRRNAYEWEKSFNNKNFPSYISLYDSMDFKYPGGGYFEWNKETSDLFSTTRSTLLVIIDSLWTKEPAQNFCQTSFSARYITNMDTTHRIYDLVWEKHNVLWSIIRQKYKETP